MANWQLYTGDAEPHAVTMPPAPPWRRFDGPVDDAAVPVPASDPAAGVTFRVTPEVAEAVNAALYLRRPLLLTGRPGSGKSSLIESVARELELGRVLRWNVTSRSTLPDALYRYDAIGRMQAKSINDETPPIGDYLRLGPLGTALLPALRPRALLIDEIDKSDIDLPNDLLNVFERGEFDIPELMRLPTPKVAVPVHDGKGTVEIRGGHVRCHEFPFVVLTSNGERDFPPAFLRRCIRIRMPDLTLDLLTKIVTAQLGADAAKKCEERIRAFATMAKEGRAVATDQLMNVVYLLVGDPDPNKSKKEHDRVVSLLLKQLTADQA